MKYNHQTIYTTLNKIRACSPCEDGWKNLLNSLGKKKPDDDPIKFSYIIDSNGLDDAIWCCRSVQGYDREWRLFAVWCAQQVLHLNTDPRVSAAIQAAENFANGRITAAARDAAGAAAWDAARDAARDAEGTAAWAAAWDAAGAAAWDAARDAAWDAARDAARDAAGAAARDAARAAAWAAARAAAGAAARAAAWAAAGAAAGDAAWDAARAAAWAAARDAQTEVFRRIVDGGLAEFEGRNGQPSRT